MMELSGRNRDSLVAEPEIFSIRQFRGQVSQPLEQGLDPHNEITRAPAVCKARAGGGAWSQS